MTILDQDQVHYSSPFGVARVANLNLESNLDPNPNIGHNPNPNLFPDPNLDPNPEGQG